MMNDFSAPRSLENKTIWVAGHRGMVGGAVVRRLEHENCTVLTCDLDLRDQQATYHWVQDNAPDMIIMAAAKVGGIHANATYPADFLYDNLMIQNNIIHAAHAASVEKLLFLGSSCIYPKDAVNPITEDALLTGALEPTNQAYAIAKIAGIKLCQSYRAQHGRDFISVMPCNLYGMGDTFDEKNSHVIPALMMKAHTAKISGVDTMQVWGSGTPRREFMYVDDLADALVFILQNYSGDRPLNIGAGVDMSIADLAQIIADVTGFSGALELDQTKPDGAMKKLMDSTRMADAGWQAKTSLRDGLAQTYEWYVTYVTYVA